MKNLFSLFTLATILIFTSCGKEELIQPENISEAKIANYSETMLPGEIATETLQASFGQTSEVEVTQINSSTNGGDLTVEFTSATSFFNVTLKADQTLKFNDASGNESTFAFEVNGHSYNNGVLSVDFNIGNNNLSGLDLAVVQYIIIHDDIVN